MLKTLLALKAKNFYVMVFKETLLLPTPTIEIVWWKSIDLQVSCADHNALRTIFLQWWESSRAIIQPLSLGWYAAEIHNFVEHF